MRAAKTAVDHRGIGKQHFILKSPYARTANDDNSPTLRLVQAVGPGKGSYCFFKASRSRDAGDIFLRASRQRAVIYSRCRAPGAGTGCPGAGVHCAAAGRVVEAITPSRRYRTRRARVQAGDRDQRSPKMRTWRLHQWGRASNDSLSARALSSTVGRHHRLDRRGRDRFS